MIGLFARRNSGEIWMVWRNAGGICERKTLFRMKKEADQAGFKDTRTGPMKIQSNELPSGGSGCTQGQWRATVYWLSRTFFSGCLHFSKPI